MKKNAGTIDRVLRIGGGIGLITWAVMGGPMLAYLGAVPLLTGFLGYCPVYSLFGFSTCPLQKNS